MKIVLEFEIIMNSSTIEVQQLSPDQTLITNLLNDNDCSLLHVLHIRRSETKLRAKEQGNFASNLRVI